MRYKDKVHAAIVKRNLPFTRAMMAKAQSAVFYEEQRNANKYKAIKDIAISKYSEWLVSLTMNRLGFPLMGPEDEIREAFEKGWAIDLPYSKVNPDFPDCHLKNTPNRYNDELSWTFQLMNKNGLGGRDPLFNKPDSDELIIMTHVQYVGSKEGVLSYTAPWNIVYPMLRDPFTPRLIGIKKCVYESDLQEWLNERQK